MILYTTVPEELIFPQEEQVFAKQSIINVKEGHLYVEQVSPKDFRVVRLVSTDPMAYLNESYAPGKMISLF
ncbi:MAG: YlzJ-like family protein [Bacillaceae bacterium]|nr:YlzJ-like family protein [Bacillaceae bacterium]